jgi:2-polyprenyl-3-methyl-5-hydroxy-6-metoxy-1,4-benzoquinol methylase
MNRQICPICKAEKSTTYLIVNGWESWTKGRNYKIFQCCECFTIFSENSLEDIDRFYSDGLYKDTQNRFRIFVELVQYIFQRERLSKIRKVKKEGKLLDIGCGKGRFLAYVSRFGWDVYGVEPSSTGRYSALNKNLRITTTLEELGEKKFDIVTLWHVLEHIDKPIEFLEKIKDHLDHSGVIIIGVPNIDSLQAKISASKWLHLDVPRHRLHYSPMSIRNVLNLAGYRVVSIDHFSLEFNVIGMFQSLLNLLGYETNILYRIIKRDYQCTNTLRCIFQLTMPFLSLLLLPISVFFTTFESLIKKGGTILVYAVPVPTSEEFPY